MPLNVDHFLRAIATLEQALIALQRPDNDDILRRSNGTTWSCNLQPSERSPVRRSWGIVAEKNEFL